MNLKDPSLYFNRELSWLRFNTRVLQEAQNKKTPLLERLKFIAIYSTNLDEFYMIRVAGLIKLFSVGISVSGLDKVATGQQLNEIRSYLHNEQSLLESTYKEIVSGLKKEKLTICEYSELSAASKRKAKEIFFSQIYPVIVPIAVDSTHPFPHLNNLSFGKIVKLKDSETNEIKFGIVRIPRMLPRFIQVDHGLYVPIEKIVAEFISDLFSGFELVESTPFRVTRNADIEIEEEEADDFLEMLEEGLKLRKKGEIVRLEVKKGVDPEILGFITSHLKVAKDDIYYNDIPLNLGYLWSVVGDKNYSHLLLSKYTAKSLPPLDATKKVMSVIEEDDILMYHPYESYDPVVHFIQDAAKDPDVMSIRMTLYRVGKNSPIVKALMEAAEEGKQITVLVELKARFDEENNLHWAKALEGVGAHVIYGVPGLKVHAKIALVLKRTESGLKEYVHLATGNYNPSTSRIYTDISYMTCRKDIAEDSVKFFHHLTGFAKKGKLNTLYMSPTQIKPKIIDMIENETKHKENGRIIAKSNALVDGDVIRALYKASQAGVKIDLIIRGICCLKPGVKGVSENIRVISIVGKYLEHARIFYFKNENPCIYISSADWMPRNLERRVELMTPIMDEMLVEKLHGILQLQLNDTLKSRELKEDGEYYFSDTQKSVVDSQKMMEDYVNTTYESVKKEEPDRAKRLASRLFKES
ncbi:MAG: RNA degradosome polyphosphate kinase [Campylobacterales bacterium]